MRIHRWLAVITILTAMIGFTLPLIAQEGGATDQFGLSDADFALLDEANRASLADTTYTFQADVAFALEGTAVSANLLFEGIADLSGAQPAYQLALSGSVIDPESATLPLEVELRLIGDTLYQNSLNPETGEYTGWTGISAAELGTVLQTQIPVEGGQDIDIEEILAGGTLNAANFGVFGDLLSGLDARAFTTVTRRADMDGTGIFTANVDIAAFTQTDVFAELLRLLAQLGAPETLIEESQIPLLVTVFGAFLADTTLTLEQQIDLESQRITRALLNFDSDLDPALIGQTGDPVIIRLNVAVAVTDPAEMPAIVPPTDAELANSNNPAPNVQATGTVVSTATLEVPAASTPIPTQTAIENPADNEDPAPGDTSILAQPPSAILPTAAPPAPFPLEPDTVTTILLDETGYIDATYTVQPGEVITILAHSVDSSVDTTLEIFDVDGERLAYNDDHGTGDTSIYQFDSLIANLEVPGGGTIIVRTSSYSGDQQGGVELLLQTASAAAPTATLTPTPIATLPEPTAAVITVLPDVLDAAEPISIQDRIESRIPYTITVRLTAGARVTITTRAFDNALDTKIALLDAAGVTLVENDDHRSPDSTLGRYDSRIVEFPVPATGDYTVTITGFDGSAGRFELTLVQEGVFAPTPTPNITPALNPTPDDGVRPLSLETITGTADPNNQAVYTFDGRAGDVYTLSVHALSPDLDPRMTVYLGDNNFVASGDDQGDFDPSLTESDALINNLVLQEDGEYTVYVVGFRQTSGDFELIVTHQAENAPLGLGVETVTVEVIESNRLYTHPVELQAGDYVTFTARGIANNFDPRIALLTPDGVLLAQNDDHGTGDSTIGFFDSRLSNIYIETSGTYTLEVTGYRDSTGTFALTVGVLR